ncbi:acyltransferase [Methanolobus sp. WCC5]|uniref:acyltransferase n=1 Tax=Methanolobus sp. WCC5 TaxID=3125785 RepID=UPI00324AC7CC
MGNKRYDYGDNYLDLMLWLLYTYLLCKIPFFLGIKIRRVLLKILFKNLGSNTTVSTGCKISYPQGVELGNNVGIARDVVLDGRGDIKIGDETIVGFESIILTSTHRYDRTDIPIKQQGMYSAPVIIEKNVWIGARVIILPGITISEGAIVGANAVVTKNVMPNTIVGGIPAKFLKNR